MRGTVKSCFHVINHKKCKKTTQNIALYIKKNIKNQKKKNEKKKDFGLFFIFLFFIIKNAFFMIKNDLFFFLYWDNTMGNQYNNNNFPEIAKCSLQCNIGGTRPRVCTYRK